MGTTKRTAALQLLLNSGDSVSSRLIDVFKLLKSEAGRNNMLSMPCCREMLSFLPQCPSGVKCYVKGIRISDTVLRDVTVIVLDRINEYLACCHGKPSLEIGYPFVAMLVRLNLCTLAVCKLLLKSSVQFFKIARAQAEQLMTPLFCQFICNVLELIPKALSDDEMFYITSNEPREKALMRQFTIELAEVLLSWPWSLDEKCVLLAAVIRVLPEVENETEESSNLKNTVETEIKRVLSTNVGAGDCETQHLANLVFVLLKVNPNHVWENLSTLLQLAAKPDFYFLDVLADEAARCRKFLEFLTSLGRVELERELLASPRFLLVMEQFFRSLPSRLYPKVMSAFSEIDNPTFRHRPMDLFISVIPFDASVNAEFAFLEYLTQRCRVSELPSTSFAYTCHVSLVSYCHRCVEILPALTTSDIREDLLSRLTRFRLFRDVQYLGSRKRKRTLQREDRVRDFLKFFDSFSVEKTGEIDTEEFQALVRNEFRVSLPVLVTAAQNTENSTGLLKKLAKWCVDLDLASEAETHEIDPDGNFIGVVAFELAQRVVDVLDVLDGEKMETVVHNGLKHSLKLMVKRKRKELTLSQVDSLVQHLTKLQMIPFETSKMLHCIFSATILTCLLTINFKSGTTSSLAHHLLRCLDATLSGRSRKLALWSDLDLIQFLPALMEGLLNDMECFVDLEYESMVKSVVTKAVRMSTHLPVKVWVKCFSLSPPVQLWVASSALTLPACSGEIRAKALEELLPKLRHLEIDRWQKDLDIELSDVDAGNDCQNSAAVSFNSAIFPSWLHLLECICSCFESLTREEVELAKVQLPQVAKFVAAVCESIGNLDESKRQRLLCCQRLVRMVKVVHACNSLFGSDFGQETSPLGFGCKLNCALPLQMPDLLEVAAVYAKQYVKQLPIDVLSDISELQQLLSQNFLDRHSLDLITCFLAEYISLEVDVSRQCPSEKTAAPKAGQQNLVGTKVLRATDAAGTEKLKLKWSSFFECWLNMVSGKVDQDSHLYYASVYCCRCLVKNHSLLITQGVSMAIFNLLSFGNCATDMPALKDSILSEMNLLDDLLRTRSKLVSGRVSIYISIVMAILRRICGVESPSMAADRSYGKRSATCQSGQSANEKSIGDRPRHEELTTAICRPPREQTMLDLPKHSQQVLAERFGHLIGQMTKNRAFVAMFRYMSVTFVSILHSTLGQLSPDPLLISTLTSTFHRILHACDGKQLSYIGLNMPSHLAEFYAGLYADYKKYFEYKGEA